jgi:hypothetical protein
MALDTVFLCSVSLILSVANKSFKLRVTLLSIIMQSVVILSVMAPYPTWIASIQILD